MKHFILFSAILFTSFAGAQSTGEKIAHKLDSIIKADKLTKLAVYFQAVDIAKNGNSMAKEVFVEYYDEFRFDNVFLILIDPNKEARYYNLDKLIHWTIKTKDKILKLYFQI